MRTHVRIVGTLFMVVGALSLLFYIAFAGFYIFMAVGGSEKMQEWARQNGGGPMPGMTAQDKMGMFVGAGMMLFYSLIGGGFIYAGSSLRNLRGRTLGIAMAIVGLIPCLSSHPCCTYIFTIGVGIYGLIVLLNADTVMAFEQVAQGTPVDQALIPPPPPAA